MPKKFILLLLCLTPLRLWAGSDWKVLASTYPQAMAVVEDASDVYDVTADGKYHSSTYYKATVLKEPGIEQLSKYSDSYYIKYDKVTVKKAVVISPEGKETAVDKENIKDIPMPAFGPFYLQNIRLVIISYPQLQVGSTVEAVIETQRNEPPMDGQFGLYNELQSQIPVVRQSYAITLPASLPLKYKVYRGDAEFTRSEKKGMVTYAWSKKDTPQLIPEPSMPPTSEVAPLLVASTIPDWKAVSKWYYNLCKAGQKVTPDIEKLIADVTAGKTTQEDKIRALYFWVSQNIRYVETTMSGEKAGFKPESAEVTYQNKYGVCRDKAQFLTTLLRHIGVDAYITLITAGVKQDTEIPNLDFNHAIVAVKAADGTYQFMDPTAEKSLLYLPFADQNKYALVCAPEGVDIQLTPLSPPQDNILDISLDTTVGKDGSLSSLVAFEPVGFYDFVFRSFLNEMPPAQREMIFKYIAGQIVPGAVVSDFTLSNLDDLYTPVKLSFTFTAANQTIQAGDYLIFTAPSQGNPMDFLMGQFLQGATAPERRYPLWLIATMESRVRETLKIPAGYVPRSLPEPLHGQFQGAALTTGFERSAEGLSYMEDFKVGDMYFSGDAYTALRSLLGRKDKLRDGKVILVRQGGAQ